MWQDKLKLENTAYNRANLCCGEQEGDTKCEGPAKEAIMLGLKNPTDSVHLVITTEEAADVLTKALPKDDYRFKKFRDILMNITD